MEKVSLGEEELPDRQQQTTTATRVKTARTPTGRVLSEVPQFTKSVLG